MTRRGMALVTALLVSVVLLILGISFLNYLENDYHFASKQDKSQQAYYLALAGLEYQRTRLDRLSPRASAVTEKHSVPNGDPYHYFEITVFPDGRLESVGTVAAPLKILAQRKLTVAAGKPIRVYGDPTQ